MKTGIGRILSLLVAIGYVVAASYGRLDAQHYATFCLAVLFPVALIWFADELSEVRTYFYSSYNIDEGTPAIFIKIMGWFFLLGMPVISYFVNK